MKNFLSIFLSIAIFTSVIFNINVIAYDGVSLIGVNDKVLDYQSGMEPIVYSGRVCVPYTVFSKDVGVSSVYSSERKVLTLYDLNHIVTLDITSGTIQDENLNKYSGSAFFRGDVIYVPAEVVCDIFELEYSIFYSQTEIVRIKNDEVKLSDEVFKTLVDASYASMDISKENESSSSQNQGGNDSTTTFQKNINEIYPVFRTNMSKEIVDAFSDGQITYFIDKSSFENSEILRYTYVKNNSIGIYVPDGTEDVNLYIGHMNEKLFEAIGIKTRLILLENDEMIDNISENSYVVVSVDYDYYSSTRIMNTTKSTLMIDLTDSSYISMFIELCNDETISVSKADEFNY